MHLFTPTYLKFWPIWLQDDSAEYRKAEHSSQKLLAGLLGTSKSAHGSQKFYGEHAVQQSWPSHQVPSHPLLGISPRHSTPTLLRSHNWKYILSGDG